jgi:hypothetical protein
LFHNFMLRCFQMLHIITANQAEFCSSKFCSNMKIVSAVYSSLYMIPKTTITPYTRSKGTKEKYMSSIHYTQHN